MKTVFIEASAPIDPAIPRKVLDLLPSRVALFTTIQYIGHLPEFARQLEAGGRQVAVLETKHTRHPGQLLGCNNEVFEGAFDAFFFVGDGEFHPKALVFNNRKPVVAFNPHTRVAKAFSSDMGEAEAHRRRAAYAAFLAGREVGVLITTKYGQLPIQADLGAIAALRREFPDKRFTFLLADTFDLAALENFPHVEVFVNTACPRIGYDDAPKAPRPLLNLTDLRRLHASR